MKYEYKLGNFSFQKLRKLILIGYLEYKLFTFRKVTVIKSIVNIY